MCQLLSIHGHTTSNAFTQLTRKPAPTQLELLEFFITSSFDHKFLPIIQATESGSARDPEAAKELLIGE